MKKLSIVSLISIILDRIIKILVVSLITSPIVIINDFFNITPAYNYGAAWSVFNGQRLFLILISIIVLVLIYFIFIKGKKLKKMESITLGLLTGGIIGNLIDRVIYGYVIDYLDFKIFGYDYPIFNLADTFIVISVILLIFIVYKGDLDGSG
ncbi:MAG: signal peptidase II [Bacilli bacterium]|nr:signal peptidase II [Bacilli bacterium]